MTGEADRLNCPQWALRIYDGLAAVTLAFAVAALAWGADDDGAAALAGPAREWAQLAMAALLPAVLLFSIWLGRRRRRPETDEYLRRLIGHSAAVGVLVTVVAWSSWTMLDSWVAPPSAKQLIGLLLGASAIGYAVRRLRDSF